MKHIRRNPNLSYLKQKRELVNAQEKTVLIVQDFTQVQCQKDSYQDLIFTIYYIGENKELKHSFYHFVAKSKNNNLFVIQTYKHVVDLEELQDVKKLIIWSDGCRRHFQEFRHDDLSVHFSSNDRNSHYIGIL